MEVTVCPSPDVTIQCRRSVLVLCPDVNLRLELRSQLHARRVAVTHQRSLYQLEQTLRRFTPDLVLVESGAVTPRALRRLGKQLESLAPVVVVHGRDQGRAGGDSRVVIEGLDAALAVLADAESRVPTGGPLLGDS